MADQVIDGMFSFADQLEAAEFYKAFPNELAEPVRESNFDGASATWIIIANLAISSLPHVVAYLKSRGENKKMRVVIPGELEIDGASPDQVAQVMQRWLEKH